MKLDILTFCLLCFHFEACFVDGSCSVCRNPSEENHSISIPEMTDGRPRRAVTFHCPLTPTALSFRMKLFKGPSREELCTFYAENRTENSSTKSCNPVLSANSVSFEIRNSSKKVDTYTCFLEMLLPVYRCCVTKETHVYLYFQEIQEIQAQDPKECIFSEFTTWMLVVLTAVSTVGCICCFLFCRLRNTVCQRSASSCDYNNEYMSMAAVIPSEKSRREHVRRPIAV